MKISFLFLILFITYTVGASSKNLGLNTQLLIASSQISDPQTQQLSLEAIMSLKDNCLEQNVESLKNFGQQLGQHLNTALEIDFEKINFIKQTLHLEEIKTRLCHLQNLDDNSFSKNMP